MTAVAAQAAAVKQEAGNDDDEDYMKLSSFQQKLSYDDASAGPSATATSDEPPRKRQRRTAAVKAQISIQPESDEDDDLSGGDGAAKVEEDSEDSDNEGERETAFVDVLGASGAGGEDQPGPSGVGKDGVEAPSNSIPDPCMTLYHCPMCQIIYPNLDAFESHKYQGNRILYHRPNLFIYCYDCNVIFSSSETEKAITIYNKHKVDQCRNQIPKADNHIPIFSNMWMSTKVMYTYLYQCNFCLAIISSYTLMEAHVKAHFTSVYQTPPSRMSTDSYKVLFLCHICQTVYYKKYMFDEHKLEHEKERSKDPDFGIKKLDQPQITFLKYCFACENVVQPSETDKDHKRTCPVINDPTKKTPQQCITLTIYCQTCKLALPDQLQVSNHLKIHGKKTVSQAKPIRAILPKETSTVNQPHEQTAISKDDDVTLLFCNICEKVFLTQDNLDLHKLTHEVQNTSNSCADKKIEAVEEGFRISDQLDEPELMDICTEKQTFLTSFCETCSVLVPTEDSLNKHKIQHSLLEDIPKLSTVVYCHPCQIIIRNGSEQQLAQHKFTHSLKDTSKEAQVSTNLSTDNFLVNIDDLVETKVSVSENKTQNENVNGLEQLKQFRQKYGLRTRTSRARNLLCGLCQKGYAREKSLVQHMLLHDPLTQHEKCSVCRESVLSTRIEFHMKVHSSGHKSNEYQVVNVVTGQETITCNFCGAKLLEDELFSHLKTHARKFTCEICSMGFESKAELTAHRKSNGDTHFKCSLCDKIFLTLENVEKHIKGKHKEQVEVTVLDAQ